MSAPVRFLAVAVAGWVTMRAAAGALEVPQIVPPAPAATPPPSSAFQPMEQATTYAPLPAVVPMGPAVATAGPMPMGAYPQVIPYPLFRPVPMAMPVSYPAPVPAAMPLPPGRYEAAPLQDFDFAAPSEPPSGPSAEALAGPPIAATHGLKVSALTPARPSRLDRWSLSSWALLRQEEAFGDAPSGPALAVGGQLGGSQAGARLGYKFNPRLGVGLRFSAPIPAPGAIQPKLNGEAALGVSYQPLRNIPIRLVAERRQQVGGTEGGRNAFALLAEGGVYARPLPLGFRLDGYGQSGIVSLRSRDWFVDGGVTVSRALLARHSLGVGAWGGAQAGLTRLDLGPRVSVRLMPGINVHLDYRWRALGKARPGSGYAMTVAGDF